MNSTLIAPKRLRQFLLGAGLALSGLMSTSAQAADRVVLGNTANVSLMAAANPAFLQKFQSLYAKAQSAGGARVIIGIRVPFAPVGTLSDKERVQQLADIHDAQTSLLSKVPSLDKPNGVLKRYEAAPFMALEVTAAELDKLARLPEITSIEEDRIVRRQLAQSTPLIGLSGGTFNSYTGNGQTVAILDTGVEKTHSDLTGRVISEACYSTTSATYSSQSLCPGGASSSTATDSAMPYGTGVCPTGECDHGTHVAGIAAGANGVARGASIIAVQVFSKFPAGAECGSSACALSFTSDQDSGLQRVYNLRSTYNIAAVNMSLGGGQYTSQATCDADSASTKALIDNLRSVGIATVIASGNNGYTSSMSSPGCISSAISVGATWDSSGGSNSCESGSVVDSVTCYSNSASFLKLLAPGSLITAPIPGNAYGTWNGTSMATPHVAGAWAVLKSKAMAATVDEVYSVLSSTGTSVVDARNSITKPRINVASAVSVLSASGQALTLTFSGTGVGTVTSSPTGMNCTTTCVGRFTDGDVVTLTATADSSSTFTGWSGDCSGSGSTCTVTMSAARAVTATFTLKPATTALSVTDLAGAPQSKQYYEVNVPAGATDLVISISGGTPDADLYVKYGAQPTTSSYDCRPYLAGNNEACTFATPTAGTYHIMLFGFWSYSGVTLTATYRIDPTLTITKAGTGTGTVSSSPAGISCGTDCSETYPTGTLVTLTATPASGSQFGGWSGSLCSGTSSTCAFTLNSSQSVTATFSPRTTTPAASIVPILMLLLD